MLPKNISVERTQNQVNLLELLKLLEQRVKNIVEQNKYGF